MKRTAQYEYWPNKTKKLKKMPAFEIDVFNKICYNSDMLHLFGIFE